MLIDVILIRKEAQSCDYTQRLQITHLLGGDTGSGLITSIVNPDRITACNISVYIDPSLKILLL